MTQGIRVLLLSAAVATAVAGCRQEQLPPSTQAPSVPYLLDPEKLAPLVEFDAAALDESREPCVDFDGYANGKWLAANAIPADKYAWGAWDMLIERSQSVQRQLAEQAAARPDAAGVDKIVADFWSSGMDEERLDALGIAPLRDELELVRTLSSPADIAGYLYRSAAQGRVRLFAFGPYPDFKDATVNMAYAEQGGLGMPDRSLYLDADKQAIRDAYLVYISRLLVLSGGTPDSAARQAGDVLSFETRLAKASKSREELARDVSLYYHPLSIAEAEKLTPNFSWTAFFRAQGIEPPAAFSLSVPAFHQEYDRMLADVPVQQWQHYLGFHVIHEAVPFLPEPFADAAADLLKVAAGVQEKSPRWKRVLREINRHVEEPMGQLYVQVAFPPESKARMESLVENLRTALKVRIEKLDWMSDETKHRAIAKWESFTPKIGYPDKWRDWDGLKTAPDAFLANMLAAKEFNHAWNLSKIGKPVDKDEWFTSPQTVNAFYDPQANEIVFPAAILQPPFFGLAADDALNYGGIGAVIGHEMTHGYDDQGSRFGPSGEFENWWAESDSIAYKARTRKLIEQFDAYEVGTGDRVNGNLTLSENIADLGGLATAYDAMKLATGDQADPMLDNLTREQRFFLGWATVWRNKYTPEYQKIQLVVDTHAPSSIRSIGAPSNLPAFAAAFSCKPGAPMARTGDQQVVIW
ncbi:M13 family metallopeptidase [Pseudoxanthomonas putridarboris]|uniref:M13 family metallopeptidase n=1 Tax=Pseudoxanthomonas putridarboris TaxID=752605 RepID=A0ABU9IXY0_9GAMM